MSNETTNGFLRDGDTRALVLVGLDTGDYVPLESDTSLASGTNLYRRGLPA